MHVSDVSDGEGETRTIREWQMREDMATDEGKVCRVGSYDEDYIDIGMGLSEGHIDKDPVDTQQSSQTELRENSRKEEKDSDSDEGECSLESSWEQEVPEGARIMEMELRKRAIVAALRHPTSAVRQLKSGLQTTVAKDKQTAGSEQASSSTHRTASDQPKSGDCVDPTESGNHAIELEMRLRQRALQSMLAKRAQAKVQCM